MTTRFPVRRNRNAGFTLIEMLVVVLIMGILLAVAIPLYLSSTRNAGTNTAKANLKSIATAAQSVRIKTGTYPTSLADLMTKSDDLPTGIATSQTGVAYEFTGTAVTATEAGDVLGTSATNEVITYTISTGAFTGPGI